jgi:hypothetical protein
VKKLLKSTLRLVSFATRNVTTLAGAGELTALVQNKLIKLVTSGIDFKDESADERRLTEQQLLFLELHM